MATRSTITLNGHYNTQVHIYRHWDGYPECTGRHLAHVARNASTIEAIAAKLFAAKEGTPLGAGRYEFTRHASEHGDREWHYEIRPRGDLPALIRVIECPIGGEDREVFSGDLPTYRSWIAARYRRMIAQWKARKAA
jgi:hypothetical protein